jgi:phosphoribosylformylglycinamidine synthase
MDFKAPGNRIYLLGDTQPVLGASHWAIVMDQSSDVGGVPGIPVGAPALYDVLHRATRVGLVRACHDLAEGGLGVALAEMCIAGRLGCSVVLDTETITATLFGEANGRLLVEIEPQDCSAFEALLRDASHFADIGCVTASGDLQISNRTQPVLSLSLDALITAWNRNLER